MKSNKDIAGSKAETPLSRLRPRPMGWKGLMAWTVGMLVFKMLYFDFIWSLGTTFSGFQFPLGYVTKIGLASLLMLPLLWARRRWYVITICVLIDLWLVANLMYFRTYFTIIPASSYGLVGNLADFTDSVWESLRWSDLGFPATTAILIIAIAKTDLRAVITGALRQCSLTLTACVLGSAAITGIYLVCKGGFKAAYLDLMYDYSTCGAAVYTIPGAMCYEIVKGDVELTPEIENRIQIWLDKRPGNRYTAPRRDSVPQNVIILLLESFESWSIGLTVEGQELTPNLNRLLKEEHTFYAPNVLTQVKGARSIDAQLLVHTGLLPISYGAYSYRFVHNEYPSLDKAWKAKYGPESRAASFTVDKKTVWNVAVVASDFGFELYDKPEWRLDEKTGPRGRLGDMSFLRQSLERISDDAFWPRDGHTLLQCVTYSGHSPFVLPEESKKVHFSKSIPERLRNFMAVTEYTDRAIGAFVEGLRNNPKFASTMVVITGDHEGLGAERPAYRRDPIVGSAIDPTWHTPLIVLNSPVSGRYDGTMGQVDIYPTLLDLAGLWDYGWKGLGQSIFDPAFGGTAYSFHKGMNGNTEALTPEEAQRLRESYDISDLIISTNYFSKHSVK